MRYRAVFNLKKGLIMNGLIGNNAEVKLVFLSCANEQDVPTKKDIKTFYPDGDINIYKSHGHFSDSFWAIESLLAIKLNGIAEHGNSSRGKAKCITHAIRLNADCVRNLFFEMKYSAIIVAEYHLNYAELSKLEQFIKGAARANSLIESITDYADKFESVKSQLNAMSLNDPKVDNPCAESMAKLLDGYGDKAREKIKSHLDRWHEKNVWI